MRKQKVYIASPYTNGWMPNNVRLQLEAKHILLDYGFIPFSPLENHFAEIFKHRNEGDWMEWDLEWLKVCDILIRIRSSYKDIEIPSPGADLEIEVASNYSIKIYEFKNLEELKIWAEKSQKEGNLIN